jgi:hypothetical protein
MRRPVKGNEHIPRQTRQAIRQRLLARDSIKDRYVPDPAVLGRPFVSFAIAQPFTEALSNTSSTWRSELGAVNLWTFGDALFGVFFSVSRDDCTALRARLFAPGNNHTEFLLDCDSRNATVPVFFDFEASWAHICGLQGTLGYPQAMPTVPRTDGTRPRILSPAEREAVTHLLSSQNSDRHGASSGGLVEQLAVRARELRVVNSGLAELRTFLDPGACSRWAGNFPEAVSFVRGELVEGIGARELFKHLLVDCRISPFLFATDQTAVLFACLATRGARPPDASLPPLATIPPSLQKFLRRLVVFREPLDQLQTLIDHRYDRPFAESLGDW